MVIAFIEIWCVDYVKAKLRKIENIYMTVTNKENHSHKWNTVQFYLACQIYDVNATCKNILCTCLSKQIIVNVANECEQFADPPYFILSLMLFAVRWCQQGLHCATYALLYLPSIFSSKTRVLRIFCIYLSIGEQYLRRIYKLTLPR